MAGQPFIGRPIDRRPPHRGRPVAVTIALASLLSIVVACGPAAPTGSQPPARREEQVRSPNAAETALMNAERANASFAAIPAGVDAVLAANPGTPEGQVTVLRQAAERAYREEGAMLREWLLANAMVPANATDLTRSLTALAKAHDATATGEPWTEERSIAVERAVVARPDGQRIIALSASMAAPRFIGEQALTTRRMAWALDRLRRCGAQPLPSDVSDQVADAIAATRQAEDAKASTRANAGGTGYDGYYLVQALLQMPAADIATLTAWYGSPAGKVAKERLVGGFQGANDRAGRMMLIDILTRAGICD